ncbi:hypothetical protein Cgig2_007623 [Carnegiea gigantea]|uniref:Ubiquitin-like protease family profile domain-containing protein n=1 Tax=Carnegiea gigantea TaxID=171969 RepID=A0A9Q1JNG6_9CARY|nr:hypothetical protein Cgig2_007623 [Carnegiea gigantea]
MHTTTVHMVVRNIKPGRPFSVCLVMQKCTRVVPRPLPAVGEGPGAAVGEEDVRNYLMRSLSADDHRLLSEVRGLSDIVAIDVKGLVNVVPRNGPGDKGKDYCINGFAIDYYSSLLMARQQLYPKWCRQSIFAKATTGAKLATIGYMLPFALPKHMSESVSVIELNDYQPYIATRHPVQKVAVTLTMMKTDIYAGALMWDLIHVDCPQQDKDVKDFHLQICGHNCGVLAMIFMDLLALTGRTMCFNYSDIRTLRDKCLADILRGTM